MQRLLDTRFPEGWLEKIPVLTGPARTWAERNGRFREMMVSREVYERERKRPLNDATRGLVR
jgi:hypothetical protein